MDTYLEDRRRIAKSGIEDVFTPTHPIDPVLFCGRNREACQILEGLYLKGGHVILYGDRGVGKTSLALFACSKYEGAPFKRVGCSTDDSFMTVMEKVFAEYGISITTHDSKSSNASISIPYLSAGKEHSKEYHCCSQMDNATWVGAQLLNQAGILFLDEFDTIPNSNVKEKHKFAELMKYLSDRSSDLHVFVVGISNSIDEIFEGHKSVDRCLTQVQLHRMSNEELRSIIEKGEQRTGVKFEQEVKDRIVNGSLGFPYFTHLISLHASRLAVIDGRDVVTMADYNNGLLKAMEQADHSLKDKYKTAVGYNDNLLKRELLYVAALLGDSREFTMKEWIAKYKDIFNKDIANVTINGQMQKNIGKQDSLLRNIKKGVYIFEDSRMPCYISLLGKPE